jgi:hypothetical protein
MCRQHHPLRQEKQKLQLLRHPQLQLRHPQLQLWQQILVQRWQRPSQQLLL